MERELALEILIQYERDHTYLNIALNRVLSSHYDQRTTGRVTALVYGTIQYRLYCMYQLSDHIAGHRVKVMERMLLLMSIYEYYFMHTSDYAVVNEAVKIATKKRGKRAGAFINGVLRSCFAHPKDVDRLSEDERLSITYSYPLWLVKMLTAQYGKETCVKILESENMPPHKAARVNSLKISRDDFLASHPDFKPGHLADSAVLYEGGNIAHTDAFKQGLLAIQDEASQMVAALLAPDAHDDVLDMCSAPGGKTTHMAALMANDGHIDAYDVYEHKRQLIADNCHRLGVSNVEIHIGDATDLTTFQGKTYDKVLLDGPCSGLGVMARKIEIRYQASEMMDKIIVLQEKLLDNAYLLCKNNGKIVYSTCTLNKKENERQIAHFLKKHPDVKKITERTILPYEYHTDGFYMCLLEK